MTSIWVEALARSYDAALDLLAAAVRDCPGDRWVAPMWEVPDDLFGSEPPGPDGEPVTDPAARRELVQRRSTPWSVAWHALECVDYDLVGEFGPWAPPPPFAGNPHWLLTALPQPWTRGELLGYVEHVRTCVHDVLATMTDERAATPLPPSHRYAGQPHAWILMSGVGHTIEHATQIERFIAEDVTR